MSGVGYVPLSELYPEDIAQKNGRLTLENIAVCDLLILTDKVEKKFRVFKDRFQLDILGDGDVHDLLMLETFLRIYNNMWLWDITREEAVC